MCGLPSTPWLLNDLKDEEGGHERGNREQVEDVPPSQERGDETGQDVAQKHTRSQADEGYPLPQARFFPWCVSADYGAVIAEITSLADSRHETGDEQGQE